MTYINSDRVKINPLKMPEHIIFNFQSKIELSFVSGCWIWMGVKNEQGYGLVGKSPHYRPEKKNTKAHQLSWIIYNGNIPNGMYICHRCDNPSCVNPDHLFLGTPKDNTRDKMRKGRHDTGRGYKGSKLSRDDILEIRRLGSLGMSPQEIGEKYDLSRRYTAKIISRDRCDWVE